MPLSLEEFVRDLSASQLLSAEEVRAVEAAAKHPPRDAQELAKALVKAGRLTKYQAANAAQGKAKNLVFDDYVVLDTWPAGGSSQLYQAEHRRMKRRVALRLLPPFAADKSSTALARFQREVQAAARLEHSHLLAAYHAGEAHGVPYLVLQYVDGQNLEALVRERGPLPWAEAVAYITQAARALSYAHEKGVVHRDVKPANMLVDKSGVIKISGLGLARIEDDTEKSLTQTGELIGTPEYMSPEQGKDAKQVDARSDVYSLGCTLYFLLTGKPMYERSTPAQQIVAHCQQAIPVVRERRADVPATLESVFAKMVAKSPAERYPSMAAVIEALERVQEAARSKGGSRIAETVEKTTHLTAKVVGGLFATIIAPMIVVYLTNYLNAPSAPAPAAQPGAAQNAAVAPVVASSDTAQPAMAPSGPPPQAAAEDKNLPAKPSASPSGEQVASTPTAPRQLAAATEKSSAAADQPAGKPTPVPRAKPVQPELVFPREIKGKHPNLANSPFAPKAAHRLQQTWAKYLNVPAKAENTLRMTLVLIPPGEFSMGSTDEQIEALPGGIKRNRAAHVHAEIPQHRVTLTRPFYMSATEVTVGQFRQFVDATGYRTEVERRRGAADTWKAPGYAVDEDSPVTLVTWNDAVEFCNWLSDHEGLPRAYVVRKQGAWKPATTTGYRLPGEAQWEFACRAGTVTNYSFGDDVNDLPKHAWLRGNSSQKAHAVGTLAQNAFGLFDMHGNVTEWCHDWYDEGYYASSPAINPGGPDTGARRVTRGLGWNGLPVSARSASRNFVDPDQATDVRGFRVIRNGPTVPLPGK